MEAVRLRRGNANLSRRRMGSTGGPPGGTPAGLLCYPSGPAPRRCVNGPYNEGADMWAISVSNDLYSSSRAVRSCCSFSRKKL